MIESKGDDKENFDASHEVPNSLPQRKIRQVSVSKRLGRASSAYGSAQSKKIPNTAGQADAASKNSGQMKKVPSNNRDSAPHQRIPTPNRSNKINDALSIDFTTSNLKTAKQQISSPKTSSTLPPNSSLNLNKRSKIIEKLKELTEKQKSRLEHNRVEKLTNADFVKAGKNDEYLEVLNARQTLHVDLTKLKTLCPSQDDLTRSGTRAATKSDKQQESPPQAQKSRDSDDSDTSSTKSAKEEDVNPAESLQSPKMIY